MCVCDSLHRSVQLFHHQPTNNAHINQSVYTEDKREAPYLSLEDSTVHHIPLHCVNCSISVQTLPAVHTSTSTAQSRFRPSQQYTLVLQLLNLRSDPCQQYTLQYFLNCSISFQSLQTVLSSFTTDSSPVQVTPVSVEAGC